MEDYATWLQNLESQNLLDVDAMKPLVSGNDVTKALGVKNGPWMKKALDIAVESQLRYPDQNVKADAIAEIVRRRDELGIP